MGREPRGWSTPRRCRPGDARARRRAGAHQHREGHRGQGRRRAVDAGRAARRGPPADRGRARRRQDDAQQVPGPQHRLLGAAHPVHPDLLPSDVTGVSVFNQNTREFEFRPGGVFANIVVGDEINRASPKTQSALLECMEERQVTVDNTTYELDLPFMVIASQNPIEMEGTYALPEAQRDRFMARVSVGYPVEAAEIAMLGSHTNSNPLDDLEPVTDAAEIAQADRHRPAGPRRRAGAAVRRRADVGDAAYRGPHAGRLAARHPAPGPRRQGDGGHQGPRLRPPRRRARAGPARSWRTGCCRASRPR